MNGWEMANAYSELNDPIFDQRERFKAQEALLAQGDDEANTNPMRISSTHLKSVCLRQAVSALVSRFTLQNWMYFICEKALKIHKYTKFTPNGA